ncbi:hypothetical protein HMPREF1544_05200 [Mucor circinelloides 1006PhL]|uniref:ER transporter 6TM N-terminal domain-containing protein n=1 Tax=Mucor circinelloides f. circinelloides (strain 1006PhL) TaxID=1220926 RepID=S2JHM4_MUCC1|nr:hypothetical protein HMPREF1544_05200 [Mucor circinelloides 1006PhL]
MPVDTSADLIVAEGTDSKPHSDQQAGAQQYTSRQTSFRGETITISSSSSDDSLSEDEADLSEQTSYFPKQLGHMPFISPEKYRAMANKDDKISSEAPTETRTERIIGHIQKRAPGRIIRRILKCTIAYFISTLFSTIDPLAKAIGQAPYIVCSGCLLSHPGRTVGAQLDATITSTLGAGLAIVYGLAGIAAATAYNAQHPDSYAGNGINCLFLVVGVFAAQLIRQKFSKLHFFSLQFMVVLLFSMTAGVGFKSVPLRLSGEFGLPFLIGAFVSLFVNVIFWPETAVDGLGRTLNQTLYDTKDMLNMMTNQFFLDPKSERVSATAVDSLAEKMREGMMKVNTAYKEAKYEVSYAYSCSSDLNPMRQYLDIVTKHLSILGRSLKSEQVLFERNFSSEEESSRSSIIPESDKKDSIKKSYIPQSQPSKETDLSKAAFTAATCYMQNGSYSNPYSQYTGDQCRKNPSCEDIHQKSVQFKSTSDSKLKQPALNTSQSRQESENEDAPPPNARSEQRKSLPTSLRSIFSTSQPGTPKGENNHQQQLQENQSKEDDMSDSNQHTVNSVRSFLNLNRLSGTLPKPPQKPEKRISSDNRQMLVTYLEKLRDPLLSLAVECGAVLDCIRDSLCDQLDMSNNSDAIIRHTSFWTYLLHTLQIKTVHSEDYQNFLDKRKRNASFLCNCSDTLRLRIQQFDQCEKERMEALYKINLSRMRGERLDLGIRDELFLVFFFIFTMREVASNLEQMAAEMRKLQEKTLAQMKTNSKHKKKKKLYMPQITTQTWKKWFYSNSYQEVQDHGGYSFGYLQHNMPTNVGQRDLEEEYKLSQLSTNRNNSNIATVAADDISIASSNNANVSYEPTTKRRRRRSIKRRTADDAIILTELEAGSPLSANANLAKPPLLLRLRYRLWLILRYLQNYEFRFALKLSAAVGILTIPAWLPDYQLWFAAIRGQWAALTVISVMGPTSGGTLSAGLWRLASTIIGAFAAWAVLEIDGESGALLSGFAVVLALPFFYIHFSTSYSKVSIITLVTYMIIALSQYVKPIYPEHVSAMVWQRTLTLIVGLFTALILNWMVWPFIAREAIRKTLACTIGDLGDYFSYVMGTFLYHDEGLFPTDDEFKEAEKMERKLGKMLNTCNVLLELTDHEPRLKGPFPKEFYREMLISSHNLLDRMMSLRIILIKMSPSVKKTVRGLDIYHYRRDMVASILLHFYTLSASLKAKIPLPSFMPSARAARSRVLRHRRQEDRPEKLLRYRNLNWFAMGCSTEEIIDELEHLTDLVRFIVGDSKFTLKARRLERKETIHKKAA